MNAAKPNPAPTRAKGKALSNIARTIVRFFTLLGQRVVRGFFQT